MAEEEGREEQVEYRPLVPAALLDLVWMPSLWTITSSPSTVILVSRSSFVPRQWVRILVRARLLTLVSYTPKKLGCVVERTGYPTEANWC